ncbi:MAG: hypothetical protein IJ328_05980, partial [Muribaculaceae bacterium]|nr:hypothetical protein [Muribaculaceae bacterium]
NRTSDPSKGITSITYNHLNQPLKFTFEDGSYIEHRYRSDGTLYGRTEREKIITTTVNGGATDSWRWQSVSITKAGDFTLENAIPKRLEIDGGYISLTPYSSTSTTVAYYYYVYDNQGSVRAVLNERGELTQATDYSAYGVPSSRYAGTAANNHLHLGLEWQPMKGLSGYYNNARFRDALLAGMFYQQDPLAEKYHPFSPYHYGMNNPLKYTDYNGMEVLFSENNSIPFNMKLGEVKKYLGQHWTTLYETMDNSPYLFKFIESNRYMTKVKTKTINGQRNYVVDIELNLNVGYNLSNGEKISPAIAVLHEMGHGAQIATDINTYTNDVLTYDEVYKNKEERRNIENVENIVAKELGEPIRTSYSTSGYFKTNDVTEHETFKNKPLEHEINLTPENGYKPIHK